MNAICRLDAKIVAMKRVQRGANAPRCVSAGSHLDCICDVMHLLVSTGKLKHLVCGGVSTIPKRAGTLSCQATVDERWQSLEKHCSYEKANRRDRQKCGWVACAMIRDWGEKR